MSILIRTKKLLSLGLNPSNLYCPSKYLFIFSHMRSRSTLLAHILGSHDEICGYNELHQAYRSNLSLVRMRVKINYDVENTFQDKYLLDKILHNPYSVSGEVIKGANPKIIFLLRKPETTLQSIINMGKFRTTKSYRNPEVALAYYCKRLERLEKSAQNIKSKNSMFFIESDDLVDKTDLVLNQLSTWLELKGTLNKHYSVFSKTGSHGFGDMSSHIKSGSIHKTDGHPSITVPNAILNKAEEAYARCRAVLESETVFSTISASNQAQSKDKIMA